MSMMAEFIGVYRSELEDYLRDGTLLEGRIDATLEVDDPAFFSVDKAWDALSWLLNGCTYEMLDQAAPPLCWVIAGHLRVDTELDFGYGPPGYLTPEEVEQVHEALHPITPEQLAGNFDGEKMTALQLYPGGWADAEQSLEWLVDHFVSLKAFYANAASNNLGVITMVI